MAPNQPMIAAWLCISLKWLRAMGLSDTDILKLTRPETITAGLALIDKEPSLPAANN